MLSFVETSSEWPLTTSGFPKNNSLSHFRRSVSMPSESSSDCHSDRSSPVEDITVDDLFVPAPKFDRVKKMTNKEKKKMRQAVWRSSDEEVPLENEKKNISITNGTNSESDKERKKKKKKKWKKMDQADLGFNTSLLPRPSKSPNMNDEEIHQVLNYIDREYLELEEKLSPYENLEKFEGNRIENRYVRQDRDRKIRKAHKQVKDKYCMSVRNNDGRKKLYVHHRVMRLMQLEALRAYLHYPLPPKKNSHEIVKSTTTNQSSGYRSRPAPVQNLAHALHNDGVAAGDLPTDLISLLIALQHRDISPEDYDTLLRLDDSVGPKTVSESKLNSFKTDVVDEKCAGDVCSVCLEPYCVGQSRKFLPCGHVFHDNCIDMWLKNSSMNCPLDGLPVDS